MIKSFRAFKQRADQRSDFVFTLQNSVRYAGTMTCRASNTVMQSLNSVSCEHLSQCSSSCKMGVMCACRGTPQINLPVTLKTDYGLSN